MRIRKTDPATTTPVEMDGVKDVTMQVMVGRADGAPNFASRHFVVQPGGHTRHHSHDYEHEVYIIEGEGGTCRIFGRQRAARPLSDGSDPRRRPLVLAVFPHSFRLGGGLVARPYKA